MQSHISAVPDFEGYVWYFGSLHPAFEMSCDIEYLYKQLLFLEQNTNFPKRRWVRSKNVCLSSAFLFFFGCNKKNVFRTSSHLSTWNNTCFLFKCRVMLGLRSLSQAAFDNGFWVVYLRYTVTIVKKSTSSFFGNVIFVVLDCVHSFWTFLYKSLKNVGQCHQNHLTFLIKWLWGRPKVFALSCASHVSLVVNEKAVVRSSRLMFVN